MPIDTWRLHRPVWVDPNYSLFALLNEFQTGSCHLAFVSRDPDAARHSCANDAPPTGAGAAIGIITLEDIFEEILTEEISDEADVSRAENVVRSALKEAQRVRAAKRLQKQGRVSSAGAGGGDEGDGPPPALQAITSWVSTNFLPSPFPKTASSSGKKKSTFSERGQSPKAPSAVGVKELV